MELDGTPKIRGQVLGNFGPMGVAIASMRRNKRYPSLVVPLLGRVYFAMQRPPCVVALANNLVVDYLLSDSSLVAHVLRPKLSEFGKVSEVVRNLWHFDVCTHRKFSPFR